MRLAQYFNKKSFGIFGHGLNATLGTATAAVLLSAASTPAAALGLVMLAYTAGQINLWQETATGKPFWKPKTGHLGL